MPLECCNDTARGIVIAPGIRNSVAVRAQRALEPCHRVTAVSLHQTSSLEIERGGAHPVSNARFAKKTPGELLARILLARRRHIRVGENAIRAEGSPSRDDRFTDRNDRSDLPQWIIWVTKFMAWVHNLNTDRTRINVGIVSPNGFARVPGALLFRHALNDATIFKYHVMGRNLACRGRKALQRCLTVLHSGVMEQDHVRWTAALALVKIR